MAPRWTVLSSPSSLVSHTARFLDAAGFQWEVMELVAGRPSGRLADRWQPGWLYFCSRGCTMVLRDYPRDWQDMEWHELDGLRRQADVLSADVTRSAVARAGNSGPPGLSHAGSLEA